LLVFPFVAVAELARGRFFQHTGPDSLITLYSRDVSTPAMSSRAVLFQLTATPILANNGVLDYPFSFRPNVPFRNQTPNRSITDPDKNLYILMVRQTVGPLTPYDVEVSITAYTGFM
jgi:hypothetical protein